MISKLNVFIIGMLFSLTSSCQENKFDEELLINTWAANDVKGQAVLILRDNNSWTMYNTLAPSMKAGGSFQVKQTGGKNELGLSQEGGSPFMTYTIVSLTKTKLVLLDAKGGKWIFSPNEKYKE